MHDIRVLKNIPQKAMADGMNISQNSYSRLERGKIKMTEEKKKKAAEVLEVSENFLETFHENHIFFSNWQNGGRLLPAALSPNPQLEETLEALRHILLVQKDEIQRLRSELKLQIEENQHLRGLS